MKLIDETNREFTFQFDLPADLVGRDKIEIAFTLDRTIRAGTDQRDLGLAFGMCSIQ
jgi:hypothetical protein